ncbi:MAG: AAA family ATPase [Pseudomonadota bacterium]
MKILQMRLLSFGPFTNTVIDLSEGQEGLHILYGSNEAGKSSALRALRQMLFGIPERSPDDFIHPYARMRIGGTLRHSDGTALEFVRRKGRTKTLRAGDDETLLDESLLMTFLGPVDADLFSTMFGIGHRDLVRGGEEIIRGGGNVGQALFAAGAGISDLHRIQMELLKEAEALFSPSASKRPINEAISALRKTQKGLREAQLPSQEWSEHHQALMEAERRKGEVVQGLGGKQRELHRLERIRDALPIMARRKEIIHALGLYADAVILPQDFPERRRDCLTELRIEKSKEAQASNGITEIDGALHSLEVPQFLIDHAGLIQEVYKELGGHQKAAKDRAQLLTRKSILDSDAKAILTTLRKDLTLEQAEELRLEKAESVRILELATQYERLITMIEGSHEEISRLSLHVDRLGKRLEGLREPRDTDRLQKGLKRAGRLGALEEHYGSEREEIKRCQDNIMTSLKRQSFWQGTLEELENLSVPSAETIDGFDSGLDQGKGTLARLQTDLTELENTVLENEGEIQKSGLGQVVPSEEDLQNTRGKRDQDWQFIKKAWLEGIETDAGSLAGAYELRVREADSLADRLRREADRVADMASLMAKRETLKRKREHLKDRLITAEKELSRLNKEWSLLWEGIDVSPRSPKEMREWARNMKALSDDVSRIRQRRAAAEELNTRIQCHRRELNDCLTALHEPAGDPEEGLSDILERGRQFMEAQEKIRLERERILREKEQREGELGEAQARAMRTERQLSGWKDQWDRAIRTLGLGSDASPAQAGAVIEDLKVLFDKIKEADMLRRRISDIDRDARAFSGKISDLCGHFAADLVSFPVEQAVSELNARLTRARSAETRRKSLEAQRQGEMANLERAKGRILEIEQQLAAMCQEAGCSSHEGLQQAEERSGMRLRTESDLENLEEQLRKLSAGATIEEFVREALEVDPDGIQGQIEQLMEEMEALMKERSRLDQTIGRERSELGKMDGSERAALMAEEIQMILARLESDVEKYARLRLASAVLARSIERYRERHQGPILTRSNELFARLTLGSFEGIRVEFTDQGDPVLVGVRPGGKDWVGVEGMSDGTIDQLYLALRLASLEAYMEKNESIPFIVDDILIRFDNERAIATFQALGEFSRLTQVIFFTHHRHLVDLAEANIDSSILFKHAIGPT